MELTKYEINGVEEIGRIVDLIELLQKIKQIDALKVALESVDRFRENAIRYAQLEAAALIRVCELDGLKELKGFRAKVAAWLYGMTEYDRNKYIAMCEDGYTIDQIWKQEVYSEEKLTKKINDVYTRREWLVEEVKEDGIVKAAEFIRETRHSLPPDLAEDIIDGMRGALRTAGAVGLGDDDHTYILPTAERQDRVIEAIILRFKSAVADFNKIKEIAHAAKLKLDYKEFLDDDFFIAARRGHDYVVHLCIALDSLGLIKNQEDMYTEISKSDCYKEIKKTKAMLSCSMEKAAEKILESYRQKGEETA